MSSISHNFFRDMVKCFDSGGKILICGNGGSAAEAQHLSAELLGHFEIPRKALPAICLHTDTSTTSAIANDDGYEYVFSRQIEALGNKGDILFVLSTSGKSKNCLEAESEAIRKEMVVRYFPIKRDGESTATCQERHLRIIHDICREIDKYYAA